MSQQYQQIPSTPRVTSPSPTPSENSDRTGTYFAPITRSAAKRAISHPGISEEKDSDSDAENARARARSRSPTSNLTQRLSSSNPSLQAPKRTAQKPDSLLAVSSSAQSNGHLSPASAVSSYWRSFSRSPSPLGLIPIHRHWRSFIHRHEIPRKALHVSIGFFTLHLYARGVQHASIHPWLLGALVPVVSVDLLRHRFASFNRFYVRVLGALMRESEVHERYNGVIWYLLGAWVAMRWFPKDVGVMSILLLSWCDTAASTVGRLYGRYTPRISRGKSLAGSVAAALVGTATAAVWWGWVAPRWWGTEDSFMFTGSLSLPEVVTEVVGGAGTVGGWVALTVVSVYSGLIASASELVVVWGLDDNLTIPVLSGLGLWGFLKAFG